MRVYSLYTDNDSEYDNGQNMMMMVVTMEVRMMTVVRIPTLHRSRL